MLKIDREKIEPIFKNLSQRYKIIAPVERIGKGRLSNTSLLAYGEAESFDEIDFFRKTYFSAKQILFPVRQTLFKFKGNTAEEAEDEPSPAIVFLRSCDINAVSIMDEHFLKSGGYEDIYYKRQRGALKFFLMECRESFGSCFCVSMGTNKTEDYSVFMRKTDGGLEAEVRDEDFKEVFSGEEIEGGPRFIEKDPNPFSMPRDIDVSIFDSNMWKEYSMRCAACGRCNISCPTCACFTVQDIFSEERRDVCERTRIWSSCQVKKFSLLAGNHDFRTKYGDRMRYKVLHKIRDFRKRAGVNMCVGCGRCDDVCTEYISMFRSIERINKFASHE